MSLTNLQQRVQALAPDLVAWRRHLHAHPELSFQERETAAFIRQRLEAWGIPWVNPAGNSTIGIIRGRRPGKTVAVRADIDALPIQEETDLPYRSTRPGVMHACGHDGHTAIVLGVARLLAQDPDFAGTVKVIFQEGEETPPGGARAIVQSGAVDDCDHIIGLHLWSELPTGQAGMITGPAMAAADRFVARIEGKGGHAAAPHQAVDAVVVAASFILNLQTVVSRRVDPVRPAVITVGTVEAGYTFNVIAPRAELKGTARSFDEETRHLLRQEIERVGEATCAAFGARFSLEYQWGYPATVNHPHEAEVLRAACRQVLGEGCLADVRPSMGGEDFAYYAQHRPAAFLWLGCRSEAAGSVWPHHHPRFTIDEAALPHGVEILTRAALALLGEG